MALPFSLGIDRRQIFVPHSKIYQRCSKCISIIVLNHWKNAMNFKYILWVVVHSGMFKSIQFCIFIFFHSFSLFWWNCILLFCRFRYSICSVIGWLRALWLWPMVTWSRIMNNFRFHETNNFVIEIFFFQLWFNVKYGTGRQCTIK